MHQDIICRHAVDDFDALDIAQGMEHAGATVVSITFNGLSAPLGTGATRPTFIVWATYAAPLTPDLIDASIEAEASKA